MCFCFDITFALLRKYYYGYRQVKFFFMIRKDIAAIRQQYARSVLLESDAAASPFIQFEKWWKEAVEAEVEEVNAMTLATASSDGVPSARIVLLKDFSENGFVFFTNYESFKAQQLEENPKACLVFFWKELERQIRITGLVKRTSAADSDEYFLLRPEESRIGAITSPQSRVIESREWIDMQFEKNRQHLEGNRFPRPDYWGGYLVRPVIIEFWQGRPGRLHDRLQYTLQNDNVWKIERLAP